MDNIEDKDVLDVSSTSTESDESVETKSDKEINNKDKNFAELRKKASTLEKENAELRQKLESNKTIEKDEEKKPEKADPLKVVFERDLKDVAREWNKKNKVTADEWAELKKRVTLKGDETRGEIQDKIDEAYHSLPGTRAKREKELIEKGKRQAMREFNDEELDTGSGGDVDMGSGNEPRFNSKEKNFLKTFGVTAEEAKQIDKSSDNYTGWTILDPKYK